MQFLLQVKLLLWKNFKARKRQKFRCISELTWPLCLFLLLIWVRSKGFLVNMHACNFEEKPLPSAGLLLYYQGLICTFNNTCHRDYYDTYRNYSDMQSSRFLKFVNDISSFDKKSGSWNKNLFEEYSNDIDDLLNGILTFNDTQNENLEISISTNKISESDGSINRIYNSTTEVMFILQRIRKKLEYIERIIELLKVVESIDKDYEKFTNMLSESPIIDDIFVKLHDFMCGSTFETVNLTSLLKRKKSYESFEKYIRNYNDVAILKRYEYDPDVSETCNKLYEKLESSKVFHLLWKMIKPFAKGKVIFSPNTTSVIRIINRMKETMMPELPEYNIESYLPTIDFSFFNRAVTNVKSLKNVIENYKNNDSLMMIINDTLKETVSKSLDLQNEFQKAYKKIEKLEKETFHGDKISVADILKCYSSIKFEGYQTEWEAESRSYFLCENDDLLVQISFLDINGSELNPMTAYKLRYSNI